ncbi:unnamed protein product, partial [Porites lobata]
SKKSLSPSRNIAVSVDSLPERCRHFDFEQCLRYLESQNTAKQLLYQAASRYKKFTTCGPDSFLLHFQKSLRKYNVGKVLNYLRSFEILDEADCEQISSETTSDMMVTELVTVISKKEPHAFWYLTHSLKKTSGLFQYFHGSLHCCVCNEVQEKEKEIAAIHEGIERIFTFSVATMVDNLKLTGLLPIATEGKFGKDLKKKLKERSKKFVVVFNDIRQAVVPPMRELKRALTTIVSNAVEGSDLLPDKKMLEASNSERQTGLPEVSIAVKLDDSPVEKNTNRACQDEESGQEISSKPEKPKSIIRSVPTLDIVEG